MAKAWVEGRREDRGDIGVGGGQGRLPVLHCFWQDIKLAKGCGPPLLDTSFSHSFVRAFIHSSNNYSSNHQVWNSGLESELWSQTGWVEPWLCDPG